MNGYIVIIDTRIHIDGTWWWWNLRTGLKIRFKRCEWDWWRVSCCIERRRIIALCCNVIIVWKESKWIVGCVTWCRTWIHHSRLIELLLQVWSKCTKLFCGIKGWISCSENTLQFFYVLYGFLQCFHFRKSLVSILDRNTLPKTSKSWVNGFNSPSLSSISFRYQVCWFFSVWNVLVTSFAPWLATWWGWGFTPAKFQQSLSKVSKLKLKCKWS